MSYELYSHSPKYHQSNNYSSRSPASPSSAQTLSKFYRNRGVAGMHSIVSWRRHESSCLVLCTFFALRQGCWFACYEENTTCHTLSIRSPVTTKSESFVGLHSVQVDLHPERALAYEHVGVPSLNKIPKWRCSPCHVDVSMWFTREKSCTSDHFRNGPMKKAIR